MISKRLYVVMLLMSMIAFNASARKVPPLPDTWVNSGPRHMDDLSGKTIVMIFFHNGGHQFEVLYPTFVEMAERYKDEPVLFMCVNKNKMKEVQKIAYKRRIKWPVLADERGDYAYDWGFRGINAEYDIHYGVVNASGSGEFATTEQVEEYLKKNLEKSRWKIDPKEIPDPLKKAWREFEFGDMSAALSALRPYASSSRDEIKKPFEMLYDAILESFKTRMGEAKRLEELGKHWQAYKLYGSMGERYKGLKELREARLAESRLRKHKAVQEEIKVFKLVEKALGKLKSNNIMHKLEAEKYLQAVARKYPDAEASRIALDMIK